ncbi:hypothetical protein ACH4OY_18805 [Micromonospora rubida]|uniref:Uncharacterized protein n=1 Tax=Micromonospora rubida TaxID=2697657 RepID=A0ABW7SLZ4_9ACTN
MERDEVGVGRLDGFGVRLALLMLGERPEMLARPGFWPLRLPVGMIRSRRIFSMDSPAARRRSTVCSMSSVMTGGRPPCLPLRAAASSPSRMLSRLVSAMAAKNPKHPAGAGRVVDAGQRAGPDTGADLR